jgi:hypothetical protein
MFQAKAKLFDLFRGISVQCNPDFQYRQVAELQKLKI